MRLAGIGPANLAGRVLAQAEWLMAKLKWCLNNLLGSARLSAADQRASIVGTNRMACGRVRQPPN